jgi:hypothetical protein
MIWYHKKFRMRKNGQSTLCHLLGQFETDGILVIAYKWFHQTKRRWQYEIQPSYIAEELLV